MNFPTLALDGVTYERDRISVRFGSMPADDFETLSSSILAVGQQRSTLLTACDANVVFDGWNRFTLISELNLKPLTRRAEPAREELQLVTAVNPAQRTLSAGQRALIGARLASYSNGGICGGAGRPFSVKGAQNNQRLNLDSDYSSPADASDSVGGEAVTSTEQPDEDRDVAADAGAALQQIEPVQTGDISLNSCRLIARRRTTNIPEGMLFFCRLSITLLKRALPTDSPGRISWAPSVSARQTPPKECRSALFTEVSVSLKPLINQQLAKGRRPSEFMPTYPLAALAWVCSRDQRSGSKWTIRRNRSIPHRFFSVFCLHSCSQSNCSPHQVAICKSLWFSLDQIQFFVDLVSPFKKARGSGALEDERGLT